MRFKPHKYQQFAIDLFDLGIHLIVSQLELYVYWGFLLAE